MPRGRFKRRGYHQRRLKQDGFTLSEDMCPVCYSFGCDPMAMSPLFQKKIRERIRKGLCPSCGEPKDFCKCKSSLKILPGCHTIRTHNNKKLRAARAKSANKEAAFRSWRNCEHILSPLFGEDAYTKIDFALYRHQIPPVSWSAVSRILTAAGLSPDIFIAGWDQ